MTKKYPYWLWVVGTFVTWAIVLLIVWQTAGVDRFHKALIFFAGFTFGILAASIARKVYK